MSDTWRLDFADGQFLIIPAPTYQRHLEIEPYYQELRRSLLEWSAFTKIPLYPFIQSDVIFRDLGDYYSQIASRLSSNFDLVELTPESRYRFFVCTEPVEHGDKMVLGLSGLEQLLGLSLPSYLNGATVTPSITSGRFDIDLLADLLIVFPERALELTQLFSMSFLSKLVAQASRRSSNEATTQSQQERDRDAFEKHIAEIESELGGTLGGFPHFS